MLYHQSETALSVPAQQHCQSGNCRLSAVHLHVFFASTDLLQAGLHAAVQLLKHPTVPALEDSFVARIRSRTNGYVGPNQCHEATCLLIWADQTIFELTHHHRTHAQATRLMVGSWSTVVEPHAVCRSLCICQKFVWTSEQAVDSVLKEPLLFY